MKMTLVIQLGAGQVQLLPDASCIHSSSKIPIMGIPELLYMFFLWGGWGGDLFDSTWKP